jgi:hypothetical protein
LQCGTAQRQGAMRADSWRNVRFNCLERTAQHGRRLLTLVMK